MPPYPYPPLTMIMKGVVALPGVPCQVLLIFRPLYVLEKDSLKSILSAETMVKRAKWQSIPAFFVYL